jgi:multisubunit Na+/H+ antiporter MnhC subunit
LISINQHLRAPLDRSDRRRRSPKHPATGARRRAAIVEIRLIWINSGSRAFREDFWIRGAIAMPIETAVMLFAIVIPFAIFAGVLGWAQSRTK